MNNARVRAHSALRRWGPRDPLVRAMVVNWAFGMAIGVFCAVLLLALDFVGIRSLLLRSDMMIPGFVLLCAGFAFTFGGVVCAAAVMAFGTDEDAKGKPRGLRLTRTPWRRLAAARVIAEPPRRRV